jgi:hypothetical protein
MSLAIAAALKLEFLRLMVSLRSTSFLATLGDGCISGFTNFEDVDSCVLELDSCQNEKHMPILMGQILTEYAVQAYETTRLRRNGVLTTRDLVSAKMLAELEATGEAMRYLDCDGQIAWKATPSLCQRCLTASDEDESSPHVLSHRQLRFDARPHTKLLQRRLRV